MVRQLVRPGRALRSAGRGPGRANGDAAADFSEAVLRAHVLTLYWRRYEWYDSNYGSSYTARKEEHVARMLGTRFSDTSAGTQGEPGRGGQVQFEREDEREHGQHQQAQEHQAGTSSRRGTVWKQVAAKQLKLKVAV